MFYYLIWKVYTMNNVFVVVDGKKKSFIQRNQIFHDMDDGWWVELFNIMPFTIYSTQLFKAVREL
jgi:hypothetical protein